jgi:lysophospholipid acyltransferase (LPLAT)-like uncharacterized protein
MKAHIASMLIRAVASTWRFTVQGSLPRSPAVLAFWHDEMLPVWKFFAHTDDGQQGNKRPTALTSLSKDGNLLAQTLADWGYNIVRGSSSRGSKEALETAQTLATESLMLITPDGPRGPRHSMKIGAVVAAHRAGVPLVLCRAETQWGKRLERSWDKFLVPLPFARVRITFSEPIIIPTTASRADVESARHRAESWLGVDHAPRTNTTITA